MGSRVVQWGQLGAYGLKLWSHMTEEQVSQVFNGGLRADPERSLEDHPFAFSYGWMVGQMERRVSPRPEGVVLPVWAWHSFWGRRRQPDLRVSNFTGYDDFMVTFDIPDERVLLSDFELWHYVLNNWYLPMSQEEADSIEHEASYPHEPWEIAYEGRWRELEPELGKFRACSVAAFEVYGESWEQIFLMGDERYAVRGICYDEPAIQATVWEVVAGDVVGVKKLNRRSRPNDVRVGEERDSQNAEFRRNFPRSEEEDAQAEMVEFGRQLFDH